MDSRLPGQCPGIWNSAIHKARVTDGRKRGWRQSLESTNCNRGRRKSGKGVKRKLLEPGVRFLRLFQGPRPLPSRTSFPTRTGLSLRVPGVLLGSQTGCCQDVRGDCSELQVLPLSCLPRSPDLASILWGAEKRASKQVLDIREQPGSSWPEKAPS